MSEKNNKTKGDTATPETLAATVTFPGDDNKKINVFPVVKDYGIFRVLGSTADMQGDEFPEPKYGLWYITQVLAKNNEGREMAKVTWLADIEGLKDGEIDGYIVDYAQEDREQAHKAIEYGWDDQTDERSKGS